MQKDQKAIYYITAETYESAKGSPHLEIFNQKDIEVLLLSVASALLLVAKRSSLAIFSLLAKSSTTPSFITMPNSFQKVAYFSGLFFAIFSNSITAETYESAKGSPHLEIFNQKDIEVLLLSDRVDEWMVSNFGEFDGIPLDFHFFDLVFKNFAHFFDDFIKIFGSFFFFGFFFFRI
jgi:hypothetical protein